MFWLPQVNIMCKQFDRDFTSKQINDIIYVQKEQQGPQDATLGNSTGKVTPLREPIRQYDPLTTTSNEITDKTENFTFETIR